ncbi:MAG: hypothetical protein ACM3Q4_05165 [Acidobacteriota bacterium]
MKIGRFIISLCLFNACWGADAASQIYPRWFLFQGEIPSSRITVGFVRPSLYRDSSISYAFKAGCTSYGINRRLSITGREAFWATEGGTAWMGSDISLSYDSAAADNAQREFRVLDCYTDRVKTIVLAGESGMEIDQALKAPVPVASVRKPEWVEKLPSSPTMQYAVGQAEEYFYETSSWELAERIARLSLGRQMGTTVSGLQKLTEIEGQDVRHDEFSTVLYDVKVIARWRDLKKKIFYVLIGMPK